MSSVEEDHGIRSRSQLSKEQHKDPEISPLFQKAVSETDLAQDPICFYIKNGILMKKWPSPEVPADDICQSSNCGSQNLQIRIIKLSS